jgi:hypothetical protein
MKRSIHAGLLILALAPLGFAQSAPNEARELWLARAQSLTGDVLKDGADLSSMQRAVLWVKLAKRWWREDPKRARIWIMNAIDIVERVPNKETPDERRERVETAQILLAIVTPLDQNLSKRLLTLLKADKSTENGAAYALMDAANTVFEDDPKRAAELAAIALRTGLAYNLDQLLYRLRAQDPKTADSLFAQALVMAKQDPGGMFTNILTYIAFPAQRGRSADLPVPSDALRIELLQNLMTFVNANPVNSESKSSNCGTVWWLAPLFGEFERLLPQQWPVLRQAINTCQSVSPQTQERINYNRDQSLNTVEAFLSAAADAKVLESRTNYKYRAASLAEEHKEYELALKILNDMSKEERTLMGESWDSCQWDWAADGAIEHYKNSRFREMNLLLDGVRSDLQPLAKVAFVYRLPEQSISETAPIIQILNDAIKGLRRSNIPAQQKSDWYLAILRATIKYQPAEANAVLKDGIASLNQLKEGQPLDRTEVFRFLAPALLEMDEFVVKDALAAATSLQTRTHLRLALLDATLQRLKTTSQN